MTARAAVSGGLVVWVGRAPPTPDFVHLRAMSLALAQVPMPSVVMVDPPDDSALDAWLDELVQPAFSALAVVLVVGEARPEVIAAAARAKVTCCLPRNSDATSRAAVIEAALQLGAERRDRIQSQVLARIGPTMSRGEWRLRTLEEAEALALVLAGCCPKPERRIGGLLELLINAIEHGNLEISGPEKQALLMAGKWHDELLLRLDDPRYAARTVRVTFERLAHGELVFSIEDDGAGFDHVGVVAEQLDHNETRHGRGIALARMMSFDSLVWEGRGNRVVGRISK